MVPTVVRQFLQDRMTCVVMLYANTCNIFSQECKSTKYILDQRENHDLFCGLLNFFFRWHFTGIPCELIPPFDKLISRDCGTCLVIPSSGNLRKMHISNLNIYDNMLIFGNYLDRPLCYYPNFSMEYLDMSLNVPHGYPELLKIIYTDIKGINNWKLINCSYNSLEKIFRNMHENVPVLHTIDASHNQISLAETRTFLDMGESLEFIYLSNNVIKSVKPNTFILLTKMRHLDLSSNAIAEFNVSLSNSRALRHLDLRDNKLSRLPKFTMNQLNQIALNSSHNVSINIQSNNLMCTCATKDFVEWVQHQHPPNLHFVEAHHYVCTDRYSNKIKLHKITVLKLNAECYEKLIYSCIGVGCALFAAGMLILHKKRF